MKNIVFILLSFCLAQEMEVDGDLKVTGTVDANGNPITNVGAALSMTDAINGNVLQSALRDDGVYEYLLYVVRIEVNIDSYIGGWRLLDGGIDTFSDNFSTELNTRALEGYQIHSMMNLPYSTISPDLDNGVGEFMVTYTNNQTFTLFVLKRPISEEE